VTVGVSVAEMPRGSRLQLVLLVLVWYCFAMSTIFQTFFTSFLVDPGYQEQLTTLEGILESGMKFGFTDDINMHYEESSDRRHKEILARKEECLLPRMCLQRILERGDFAILVQDWLVQEFTNDVNDHSFICLLNVYDSFPVFLSLYVRKGSPFLELANRFVRVATESGMASKMEADVIFVKRNIFGRAKRFGEYFVFNVNHLRVAFYILLVGHSVSLALLVCELTYRPTNAISGVS
jgi:hypothetical protein